FMIVPPPTLPYTLSLHDALPISPPRCRRTESECTRRSGDHGTQVPLCATRRTAGTGYPLPQHREGRTCGRARQPKRSTLLRPPRSEEHTSELQSRENLVCRLLLE